MGLEKLPHLVCERGVIAGGQGEVGVPVIALERAVEELPDPRPARAVHPCTALPETESRISIEPTTLAGIGPRRRPGVTNPSLRRIRGKLPPEAPLHDTETRTSPQLLARIAGALYVTIIIFGIFGEMFVRERLVAWGDPTATAERILASESLWRFSVAAEISYLLCAVVLAVIFLVLLRPAGRDLALLMVLFNLVAITVEAVGRLQLVTALSTLRSAETLSAFEPGQVHALAYLSLQAHGRGWSIALLFFAGFCVVSGCLIYRCRYLPRLLGALMVLAGLGYLLDGFSLILSPAFQALVFPFTLLPAFVAESALALWLLVRGVDVPEFERARAAAEPT